jgi:aryl-alcohol dehydrogenase-like predicted oxidoreductase
MEKRTLGRSGISCGRIGLGCATFGREIDEDEAFRIMDYAVERGITLFDTAETYGGGQAREYRRSYLGIDDQREVSGEMHSSEKIVGHWLRSRNARGQVVLVTKVTTNFTREHVRQALESSLDRLQTGYVDLYLYHSFDTATPIDESAAAADQCVRQGLARAVGCSNHTAEQLAAALEASRRQGLARFEAIESNYNLAAPDIESDILPLARREGLGVITYSPLAAGFLTGKYTPDRSSFPKGTRFDVIPGHADVYFSDRNFRVVELVRALAMRTGVPAPRLAFAWVLRNPAVDVVLAGARTTAHLDNALAALKTGFDPAWMEVVAV